ncbi:SUMF1/EgtB/PvdO family nonheme iron enzyme [Plantactinospora sp. CA-290183]|uniref:SUMF1/EgtB/PvdO family nonheme iron enzyme n=1 Tax=Plantactinospora sp. CA-290183 TaxID=3240006 RepID=UPI003D92E3CB
MGKWSGRETRALRQAKRMSLREFAAYLGVSDRTVSKWEAGAERIQPRPDSQAMLDTVLERSGDEVRNRFDLLIEREAAALGALMRDQPRPPVNAPAPLAQLGGGRVHPRTGKKMIQVEAGPFLFGPYNRVVELPTFYLDATPVTNADYARFVTAASYRLPDHWRGGRCPSEIEDHPVVNVTHWDAEAYCQWAGVGLPTEEQWEKATRGVHGQTYPWGDQATVAKCNVRESGIGRTTPVERYHSGVSPYGVYDLSGNVWEWCRTETAPGRYVLKGSAFTSPFRMAAGAASNDASVDMFDDDTGFRCAVTPDVFGSAAPA